MKRFSHILFLICVFLCNSAHIGNSSIVDYDKNETINSHIENVKNELTSEVESYIKQVAPTSRVNAEYLVNECHEYDVDIIFVLAQGTIESHFATKGIGGKINSIFNVCVYDNVKSGNDVHKTYRYKHPDESIEPYLQLLRERYLVNGRTEKDLLANYVNIHGQRYATYPHYETKLLTIMKHIKHTTKIDSLTTTYKNICTQAC